MAQNIKSIWVPGEGANHLELLPLNNTPPNIVASSAHADFPAYFQIAQYAIIPGKPWVAGSIASGQNLIVDKNQLFNPGAEVGTLAGWTINGDVTVVTGANVDTGTYAFQLGAEETEPDLSQEVKGRCGEKITIQGRVKAAATKTVHCYAYIKELGTNGGILQPDGTWGSTDQDWATETGTTYVLKEKHTVLPAYNELVPRGVYTVVVDFYGTGWVDNTAWWHWTDLSQKLGHGVHPIITATELRCSTDNFGASNVLVSGAFSALKWPTSFALFGLRGERWWKLLFNGESDVALWDGQWVLSQGSDTGGQYILDTLARKPQYGVRFSVMQAQVRHQTTAGIDIATIIKEGIERREMIFQFKYQTDSQWREARNRLLRQSVMGKHPIVMIYDDTNPDSAAMVRQPERFDYSQPYKTGRHTDNFMLRELAFPTFD